MQVIREINELNNRFLALYGNIYEEREHLPPKQRELMQDRLIAEYKEELEILLMRATIDRAREKYRLQLELSAYTPRTWRVLWIFKRKYNRAAAKIIDEVQAEVEAFFSGLALPRNIASEPQEMEDAEESSFSGLKWPENFAPEPQETEGAEKPEKDRTDGSMAKTARP